MPSPSSRTPSYRLHKPTGQAVVTLDGRDVYLGVHGTPASRKAYDRAVAEWLANGRKLVSVAPVTVAELVVRYLAFVDARYRSKEPQNIRLAIRPARELYGTVPVVEFGPLALKAVRKGMVDADVCRTLVNRRVQAIVRMFKWGVAEELVPSATWEALRSVEGLRRGVVDARESDPVKPVPDADVDETLPFLARHVRAMVEFQRLTGARPGEVCSMRTRDLVMTGPVWEYRPAKHKTMHHGRGRVVFIGPAAQDVIRPFLRPNLDEALFQPREAEAERLAAMRAARKTKVQPSQVDRSGPVPREMGEGYTPKSYRQVVVRAVAKANRARRAADAEAPLMPAWHPHQLRHNAATALRREFGIDVARTVLGHSSVDVTEIYAEADLDKAREAMGRVG